MPKEMELIKKVIVTLALTFTITIALSDQSPLPSKRMSRFLQAKTPRASEHCGNNEGICTLQGGANSTCCSNKCVDLVTDNNNCSACKRTCKFREACCRGECVDITFDKRHCGACNHRCDPTESCVYGMCNYA